MAQTTVVNRHYTQDWDVYCGRGTPYGNRFVVGSYGTRDECIDAFETEFNEKIKDDKFRQEVLKLKGKRLSCSCKPKRCHVDIIANWLNNMPEEKIKLSASKVKTLQSCSWLYFCNYHLKLPQTQNTGASRGLCAHTILECLINPRHRKYIPRIESGVIPPSIERLLKKHAKKFGVGDADNMQMIRDMLVVAAKNDFLCIGAKSLTAEEQFKIEIGGCLINGFIDKTAVYDDGTVEILDYKSSKAKFNKEEIDSNMQALMYSLATWKQKGIIPKVKFVFLRFPREPVQSAPKCSEGELRGFEAYLAQIASYVRDFDAEKAVSDLAANDSKRYWLCGRDKFKGEKKKDGTPVWGCPFKWPFTYYAIQDDTGKVVKTAFQKTSLDQSKKIVELKYEGCPRYNRKNQVKSNQKDDYDF